MNRSTGLQEWWPLAEMAAIWRCIHLIKHMTANYYSQFWSVLIRNPQRHINVSKRGLNICLLFSLSYKYIVCLFIGKCSTYQPFYPLHILLELLNQIKCVVLALDLQRSKWTCLYFNHWKDRLSSTNCVMISKKNYMCWQILLLFPLQNIL